MSTQTAPDILIIDHDLMYARTLRDFLKPGFGEIRVTMDSASALQEAKADSPQIFLVNCESVPGNGALRFCARLREQAAFPVVFYAGHFPVADRVRLLDAGADDCLQKPFAPEELAAKLSAIWRRYLASPPMPAVKGDAEHSLEYPGLFISLTNYTVLCCGEQVDMPPKELELLFLLASSPNQVFTREQLLNNIWGYDYLGDARTVDVHIKRIRQKIKCPSEKQGIFWSIDTVWGVGYKFSVTSSHNSAGALPGQAAKNGSA